MQIWAGQLEWPLPLAAEVLLTLPPLLTSFDLSLSREPAGLPVGAFEEVSKQVRRHRQEGAI